MIKLPQMSPADARAAAQMAGLDPGADHRRGYQASDFIHSHVRSFK